MFEGRRATAHAVVCTIAAFAISAATAAPPVFTDFEREQKLDHTPEPGALLRIWVVYIGQGDGIFIEFPRGTGATLDNRDRLQGGASEPIEMLIDGGSFLQPGSELLTTEHLIETIDDLKARRKNFQGVYLRLANAILNARTDPGVQAFDHAFKGTPKIEIPVPDAAALEAPASVVMETLWPQTPRRYSQWSKTINGNSVVMHLTYGDFTMLFTGDLNKASKQELMADLGDARKELLHPDVLKIPHHGSEDGLPEFFAVENENPPTEKERFKSHAVVGVASMGKNGFAKRFKHPREEVIEWMGGPDCIYHTHIHEKKVDWEKILDTGDFQPMIEGSHVLIETDGDWFRIVEVHDRTKPISVDPVATVRKSDGTRWIRATQDD